jgi:hypothetical protein
MMPFEHREPVYLLKKIKARMLASQSFFFEMKGRSAAVSYKKEKNGDCYNVGIT